MKAEYTAMPIPNMYLKTFKLIYSHPATLHIDPFEILRFHRANNWEFAQVFEMCALCFDGKGSIVEFGKFVILCHYSASVHFFIIQGPKHRPRSDADLHVFAIASSFFQLWPSIDIFHSYFFSFDEILSKSC
jgi:hypothetical protein